MTSEKLYGILKFLEAFDRRLSLQTNLEAIRDALSNLVSSPAQPQHQATLANALASFEAAAQAVRDGISPSQHSAIQAMGGEEFFDPDMFNKIRNSVQTNAMTPSVARDFVQDFANRRANFLNIAQNVRKSLESLHVKESPLQPGAADVAFLIPRGIFKNQLGSFAKELQFINRLIEHFSEAITGKAEPAQLEQLSSSEPTIALLAAVPVILAIGEVINKFLSAWEKIEKIRKMRSELSEMGMEGLALEQLTDQITTTVEKVVEESTELVIAKNSGDPGRKSELANAIRTEMHRLFGQIERGLAVEIRVNTDKAEEETEEENNDVQRLEELSKTMKFPEPAKEPLLLKGGEVIEGEVLTMHRSKKTTTKKTVTTSTSKKSGKESGEATT